ncbi:MAG: hypothetical protein QF579_06585 [Dehalococcoidia bacterium]|nr:hypothetical protein [Dehalococcoidia bacterium]
MGLDVQAQAALRRLLTAMGDAEQYCTLLLEQGTMPERTLHAYNP